MGFGKRSIERPSRPSAQQTTDDGSEVSLRVARASHSDGGISTPVLVVGLAVLSIAIGIGGALLHNSLSAGSGSSMAVAAQGGRTGAHARVADACMPSAGKGLRRIDMTDEEYRYKSALKSPDYFTCVMTRERERFCDAGERAIMVKELLVYFADVAWKQQIIDKHGGDPAAKMATKMAAAIDGKDDGGIATSGRRPEADPSVVADMQDLVREGYLSPSDFGWSLPAEIKPYLAGVERIRTSC